MPRCAKDPATGLTDMQAKFARLYAYSQDLNATKAAIDAGAEPGSASQTAAKWLGMAKVRAEVAKFQAELAKDARISKEWWLQRQADIASLDPSDLYDDSGFLRPLKDMPKRARLCIKKIKTNEIFDGQGDQRSVIGITKEIEALDPQKALDAIGKHMGWLKEKVEINGALKLEQLVAGEARDE